jgi:large subunit ribosomal protein L14
MIQSGTYLKVIDNSGAKLVACIQVIKGYRRRYANVGDVIVVSVKALRLKRRKSAKIKKGDVVKAIVVHTKSPSKNYNFEQFEFAQNTAVLINKQNKFIGTRVFGVVPKKFRYTRFLKLLSVSSGFIR